MALPAPILSFFARLISKDSPDPLPGNEIVSQLAVSCGSVEEGTRVAQALRDAGVLRVLGNRDSASVVDECPFDSASVYCVVVPGATSPTPKPVQLAGESATPAHASPALGRSSLSLSLTRSASRDAEGATTSAGVVRLLSSSAMAAGSNLSLAPRETGDAAPASASLVAALVQVSTVRATKRYLLRHPRRAAGPSARLRVRSFSCAHHA